MAQRHTWARTFDATYCMKSKLIIAANRLPVSVVETAEGLRVTHNFGGLATALSDLVQTQPAAWVGYLGSKEFDKKELVAHGMSDRLEPITVADDLYEKYYNRVANGGLWPVLHGFAPQDIYGSADWQANLAVNDHFVQKIVALAEPDDIIWVHDFHLMMLPKLLRRAGLKNRIGYFLHVPFARAAEFAQLPHHRDMLESLQSADLCGFQTERDVRRFREACNQLLGPADTKPKAKAFPIGIDYETHNNALVQPAIAAHKRELDAKFAGKTVIFSLSRLDYTKGIVEQLRAFGILLEKHAHLLGNVVYKLLVSPSREALTAYQEIKAATEQAVQEINARFGTAQWQPVDYDYRNMEFEEKTGWFARADIMLVAPLIDGMNLVAKEYVASHQNDEGVLVLSKNAGAAAAMRQALLVDPTRPQNIARALEKAMAMPLDERRKRFASLREHVRTATVVAWSQSFCDTLRA